MTPWTAAHQAPLSIEFFRQDYWSGLSFPPPRDLPDPRIELTSLAASALADIFFFVVFNFLLSFFFFFGRYILYHCATREAQGSLYIIPNLGSELGDPLRAQPDAKAFLYKETSTGCFCCCFLRLAWYWSIATKMLNLLSWTYVNFSCVQ